jgi:nucleotide-binding universal stress UspA family protein
MLSDMTTRTIVLGVDGSEGSAAAVRWCVEMAPLLDARVVAIHALRPVVPLVPPVPSGPVTAYDDAAERRRLQVALEQWCEPLRTRGIKYTARVVDGAPALALMAIAGNEHATAIVVGRRGEGGFAELLLGSVPHALSHHADLPVVVVPFVPAGDGSDGT